MRRPMELQLQAIVLSTSGCFRGTFNLGGGKAGVAATLGQLQLQFVAAAVLWDSCNCSLRCTSELVGRAAATASWEQLAVV